MAAKVVDDVIREARVLEVVDNIQVCGNHIGRHLVFLRPLLPLSVIQERRLDAFAHIC